MKEQQNMLPPQQLLAEPILPLVRLFLLLFITGPFSRLEELLAELKEPIETHGIIYQNPAKALSLYLDILQAAEVFKNPATSVPHHIVGTDQKPVDLLEKVELWIAHHILVRELEEINSSLCAPCGCSLCCEGPGHAAEQEFFEIPLRPEEIAHFTLPRHDTSASRRHHALAAEPLLVDNRPFYEQSPALYNWQNGWSMILPKGSSCPHLDLGKKICQIYPERPEVCRRPQIFSYLLEKQPIHYAAETEESTPTYMVRNKLLAIWDCPYVNNQKEAILSYAALCELDPIFKVNKV